MDYRCTMFVHLHRRVAIKSKQWRKKIPLFSQIKFFKCLRKREIPEKTVKLVFQVKKNRFRKKMTFHSFNARNVSV